MEANEKGIAVMNQSSSTANCFQADSGARIHANSHTALWLGVVLAGLVALLLTSVASAEGANLLKQAKADSQAGEQIDGYVGLVDDKAPDVIKKMVSDTNKRRKAKYERIATKRGSTVESVGEQAGTKLTARAKPGEMVRNAEGKWVKK